MTGGMRIKTLSALLLVVGCADSDDAKTAITDQEVIGDNGVSLNGVSLNGVSLNGVSLNGVSLNGVSLNGVSLNGVSLNGVSLNGVSLNGTDFIGAEFQVALSNGASSTVRIDSMSTLTAPNDDVYTYRLSIAADGGSAALCDGGDAVAVPGAWNTTTGAWTAENFSFACRGSSVAKCLELGYKTWYGFGDHHHACVRMLRADYCGDGVSHTVTGTPINLYDNAGVQADTESWLLDGEWSPDGALCFNNYRGGSMPSCSTKYSTSCGSFASGALLMNERQ
jgi:hypothetical protein